MGESEKFRDAAGESLVEIPREVPRESPDDIHARADEAAAKAEANLTKDRTEAAQLEEQLNKLEEEAFPEHPEPVHVDQAIGT
ncbi:MAG: hypothetical protein JO111_13320 [Caulobacteraceae bacterium]|nr:hypothetical protein [Caulobacteraceae bacterium]